MKYFYIALDAAICLMFAAVLVHYNYVITPSKWLWWDLLTSIAIAWVMAEVFIKAYLYDQLIKNKGEVDIEQT